MVKLYIYKKSTGLFGYSDTGVPEYVLLDIPQEFDFTLTPPPNTHETWYWIDNKWTTDDTAN